MAVYSTYVTIINSQYICTTPVKNTFVYYRSTNTAQHG